MADHACTESAVDRKGHKTLVECASACDGLMFIFGKGELTCAEAGCMCLCMAGLPAADETCVTVPDSKFDVYASKRDNQEVTSTVAPTVNTGETLPYYLKLKIKCR